MKEIKCTIIQDLLPLYLDEVVSRDTQKMIDEHLQYCEKCQKEYESMKKDLYLPVENKDSLFKNISNKWRKKKARISIISILSTAILLAAVFVFVFYYERVIPYSESLVKIDTHNGDQLASYYYGKSYATVHSTHPMTVEVDGEKKNVSFIYYTETLADSPSRNLMKDEKNFDEQPYIFELPELENVDAVYYAEFDVEKITDETDTWEAILDRGELIWEK